MRIFKLANRKNWHIFDETNDYKRSYCVNASLGGYRELKEGDIIKEYEGERLCKSCVGLAYDDGVVMIEESEAE